MRTFSEYAEQLEKSPRPGDAAVGRYIRTHKERLELLLKGFFGRRGFSAADREELMQVALLGCVEAVHAPDADTAIKNIHNSMQRHSRHAAAWNARRAYSTNEET